MWEKTRLIFLVFPSKIQSRFHHAFAMVTWPNIGCGQFLGCYLYGGMPKVGGFGAILCGKNVFVVFCFFLKLKVVFILLLLW